MTFTVETVYYKDDVDHSSDPLSVFLLDENGETIFCGDFYHDKIDEMISGFFKCLDYLKIEYVKIDKSCNSKAW